MGAVEAEAGEEREGKRRRGRRTEVAEILATDHLGSTIKPREEEKRREEKRERGKKIIENDVYLNHRHTHTSTAAAAYPPTCIHLPIHTRTLRLCTVPLSLSVVT